ncbi:heme utilization protein HutZ [Psychromonas aquatilis]|uniref:Heme utilization protein HutZ n=1 Tax=Psychromonas aquatilis TaxID=2005072 RepID=A0ABU9GSB0_9GAMM
MVGHKVVINQDHNEVKKERLQNRLGPEIQAFRDKRLTLQLATIDEQGKPHASYTPFAFDQDGYYILISYIAKHGQNLKENKQISIMMLEDESEAKNLHARKRLTFDSVATELDKTSVEGVAGIEALISRFGEMAVNLSRLNDFYLYRLVPSNGRYVKGFGQAYNVSGNDLVDFLHLDQGHDSGNRKSK